MKHVIGLLFLLLSFTAPPLPAQEIEQESDFILLSNGERFLRWHGHTGRSYFLQASDADNPLAKWKWAPVIEAGNDEEISYEAGATLDKAFFRLKYTDQTADPGKSLEDSDFDNDGLTNLREISPPAPVALRSGGPIPPADEKSTDPLDSDTDDDGMGDGFEDANGFDPNNPDENGNGIPDGTDDADGDGAENDDEESGTTDPNAPTDFPIQAIEITKYGTAYSFPTNATGTTHTGQSRWGPEWTHDSSDAIIDFAPTPAYINGLIEGIAFPDTPPASPPSFVRKSNLDIANIYSRGVVVKPDGGGISVGNHFSRVWIKAPVATGDRKFHFLKVRETSARDLTTSAHTDTLLSVAPVEIIIPAGQELSAPVDLKPVLSSAAGKDVTTYEKLLLVRVKDISNNQIITDNAWIKAHKTNGSSDEPDMPKLEVSIPGLPATVQVLWKLASRYPRRNGRDDLDVPYAGGDDSGVFTTGDQPWKIWEDIDFSSDPVFGGNETLDFKSTGANGALAEGVVEFKIRGENPDDARCKAYIVANQGDIWYAWAVAKHESKDSAGFYNQFANGLPNGGAGAHGAKGEPFYAQEEGDGWGLFQRDSSSGYQVTTAETWSWSENMKGFLHSEYPEHIGYADDYVDSVRQANPQKFEEPVFVIKGNSISGRHLLALTRYNGAQGRSKERLLHFNPNGQSGQRWSNDLPDAPGDHPAGTTYADLIMDEYNGG